MNFYELITILTSVIAIIISTVTLVRTRKLAAEQLELARITAELSRLQIKSIEEQDTLKTKPKFNVAITKLGTTTHFVISNTGMGSAFNVELELIECTDNPLMRDSMEMLPYPEMKPNSRIKLIAAMNMASPQTYQVKLTWRETSEAQFSDIFWVSR